MFLLLYFTTRRYISLSFVCDLHIYSPTFSLHCCCRCRQREKTLCVWTTRGMKKKRRKKCWMVWLYWWREHARVREKREGGKRKHINVKKKCETAHWGKKFWCTPPTNSVGVYLLSLFRLRGRYTCASRTHTYTFPQPKNEKRFSKKRNFKKELTNTNKKTFFPTFTSFSLFLFFQLLYTLSVFYYFFFEGFHRHIGIYVLKYRLNGRQL